jgi:hypothetical protein
MVTRVHDIRSAYPKYAGKAHGAFCDPPPKPPPPALDLIPSRHRKGRDCPNSGAAGHDLCECDPTDNRDRAVHDRSAKSERIGIG